MVLAWIVASPLRRYSPLAWSTTVWLAYGYPGFVEVGAVRHQLGVAGDVLRQDVTDRFAAKLVERDDRGSLVKVSVARAGGA